MTKKVIDDMESNKFIPKVVDDGDDFENDDYDKKVIDDDEFEKDFVANPDEFHKNVVDDLDDFEDKKIESDEENLPHMDKKFEEDFKEGDFDKQKFQGAPQIMVLQSD